MNLFNLTLFYFRIEIECSERSCLFRKKKQNPCRLVVDVICKICSENTVKCIIPIRTCMGNLFLGRFRPQYHAEDVDK